METPKISNMQLTILKSMARGTNPARRIIAKLDAKIAELVAQRAELMTGLNVQIAAINSYSGVEDYTTLLKDPTVPTTEEELPNLPFVEEGEVTTLEESPEGVEGVAVEDTVWA